MNNGLIFKICIGDLAAYNNGFLVFEWIDLLELSWEEVIAKKNAVLEKGYDLVINQVWEGDYDAVPKHEEWHIQDCSNNIGIQVHEYSNLEKLYDFAEEIQGCDLELLLAINEVEDIDMQSVIDGDIVLEDYRLIDANNDEDLGEIMFQGFYGDIHNAVANIRTYDEHTIGFLNLLADNFNFKEYGRKLVSPHGPYTRVDNGYLINHGE